MTKRFLVASVLALGLVAEPVYAGWSATTTVDQLNPGGNGQRGTAGSYGSGSARQFSRTIESMDSMPLYSLQAPVPSAVTGSPVACAVSSAA